MNSCSNFCVNLIKKKMPNRSEYMRCIRRLAIIMKAKQSFSVSNEDLLSVINNRHLHILSKKGLQKRLKKLIYRSSPRVLKLVHKLGLFKHPEIRKLVLNILQKRGLENVFILRELFAEFKRSEGKI